MVVLPPVATSENPISRTPSFDLQPFKAFLASRQYSDSTIRNYIVDVNRYLASLPLSFTVTHIFSDEYLSSHLSTLTTDSNYRRYLSALNLFCQFALDQHLINQNPLPRIANRLKKPTLPTLQSLVLDYKNYLIHQNTSPVTIHNYINDLNQYITWLETTPNAPTAPIAAASLTASKSFSFKSLFKKVSGT